MLLEENAIGKVELASEFFVNLVESVLAESFGVVGTVSSFSQRIKAFARPEENGGVVIKKVQGRLYIDLHIEVKYGVNIAEVTKNLVREVKYVMEDYTKFEVANINVYVEKMSV